MSLGLQSFGADTVSRWLARAMWRLEHAFERARASDKPQDDTRLRIFFVATLFSAGFLTLAIGATRAALFSDAGRADGSAPPVSAARGDLVDRNGELLAADLLHYGLYLDPREIWDAGETRRALRAALPDLTPERLERALQAGRRTFLIGGLTPEVRSKVNELGLPGVSFEPEERRVYPLGYTGAHLIGFVDSGGEGLAGAEAAFNGDIHDAATAERNVPLSIDLRVQAAAEDELYKAVGNFRPKGAVAVVVNVHTGEILALANYPTFDPNKAGEASLDARLNRAAASIYEMGSTFKGFTVAAGLDSGVATPMSTFDARQPFQLGYRTIHDYHATHKILTLVEVFQHSSNIGTARLAEAIGVKRLEHYFKAFGLTEPAKIELVESARPLTPRTWDEDAVASTSFGHGMNVSPLAVARAYSGLLNGGKLLPLTIHKLAPGARPDGPQIVSPHTTETLLQIMRANVTGGSGKSANVSGLNVGGKTGTGDKFDPVAKRYSTTKQVSSFAAVFPTDGPVEAPRYFVLVLMDEPHPDKTGADPTGGIVAAPAAGRIIERIAPFLGVQRRMDTAPFTEVTAAPSDTGEEH
ncbi:MAG TPA: penicillin-binding protein 2 [Phenylobacterium sp.]|uniref:peptidoglycan D,D-transpeptidase FtsI family protein n=1 Tax=Phenylobacterium sp. TaxID=1871053 RepID=UPI002B46E106|nr:penicillin-binding protein 2 [Phenylobacterium sp.]HKR88581.1 penicillin-binding protein 2 [Phenylobacterium sp.]